MFKINQIYNRVPSLFNKVLEWMNNLYINVYIIISSLSLVNFTDLSLNSYYLLLQTKMSEFDKHVTYSSLIAAFSFLVYMLTTLFVKIYWPICSFFVNVISYWCAHAFLVDLVKKNKTQYLPLSNLFKILLEWIYNLYLYVYVMISSFSSINFVDLSLNSYYTLLDVKMQEAHLTYSNLMVAFSFVITMLIVLVSRIYWPICSFLTSIITYWCAYSFGTDLFKKYK